MGIDELCVCVEERFFCVSVCGFLFSLKKKKKEKKMVNSQHNLTL